jgi:hypothetical protein
MSCSRSVSIHLLRGVAALALIVGAVLFSGYGAVGSGLAVVGALLLLRGCPMCWLIGLIETISHSRSRKTSAPT